MRLPSKEWTRMDDLTLRFGDRLLETELRTNRFADSFMEVSIPPDKSLAEALPKCTADRAAAALTLTLPPRSRSSRFSGYFPLR